LLTHGRRFTIVRTNRRVRRACSGPLPGSGSNVNTNN
jgi:hypothetical protein